MIAAIPSPSTGVYHVGPLTLHMYGVMLLLAIAGAVWLGGRRWVSWGGDWDLIFRIAVWGVIAGIVGARIYHLITNWEDPAIHAHWYGPFAVWEGGLGVWGGITLGVLVGAVIVRRSGNSVRVMMDAVAPGLLLAQGIGRWGNYFNQELYGKATSLPWGLKITHPTAGAPGIYHPTFLYEFIWDVLGVLFLLWVDRRYTLRRPALFALYVMVYTAFRTFEETLRIDDSHHFLGQRINFWVSLALFVASTLFFLWWQFRRPETREPERRARPIPKGPTMSVPRGRVR